MGGKKPKKNCCITQTGRVSSVNRRVPSAGVCCCSCCLCQLKVKGNEIEKTINIWRPHVIKMNYVLLYEPIIVDFLVPAQEIQPENSFICLQIIKHLDGPLVQQASRGTTETVRSVDGQGHICKRHTSFQMFSFRPRIQFTRIRFKELRCKDQSASEKS